MAAPLERLHRATIAAQLPIVLVAIPVVTLLYGIAIAPVAVDIALDDAPASSAAAAIHAVRIVVWMLVGCVVATTAAAGMLLRGSIRATVEQVHAATRAIADGEFDHRIGSARRDELGRLAGAIDGMADCLARLEESRRRFLACVSHELRTPLTVIRGTAFTMARRETDEDRRGRLELIQEESARLGAMVEDLVDASSLFAGRLRLEPELREVMPLVRAASRRFEVFAAGRGVRLIVQASDDRALAELDPVRFEQLLGNLVGNGIRHATPGSDVTVQARHEGDSVVVRVSNPGRPIPTDIASQIFEPFVQGEESTGRLGLGLAIAHGLAEAHDATLLLVDTGASSGRISFEFRVAVAEMPSPERQRRSPRAVRRPAYGRPL